MKKTLRLIITLDCNLSCSYCCNKLSEVNSKFITKTLEEIDFNQYEAICITGGEPLLRKDLILRIINYITTNIPVYLYTNGLLLHEIPHIIFNGISIGIHYKNQIKQIFEENSCLLAYENLRLYVQDIYREKYLPNIPDKYIHTWTMNSCFNNVETEDWILLKE